MDKKLSARQRILIFAAIVALIGTIVSSIASLTDIPKYGIAMGAACISFAFVVLLGMLILMHYQNKRSNLS